MDGNQFGGGNYSSGNGNGQDNGFGSGQPNSNYQDNTANSMYYQAPPDNGKGDKADGKQIAGLVFGILAICTGCCPACYGIPGIIFGIVGLVLSILGNKDSKSGIGIAGLVCSIIGLICGIAWVIFYVVVFAAIFSSEDTYNEFMRLLEQYMEYMEQM